MCDLSPPETPQQPSETDCQQLCNFFSAFQNIERNQPLPVIFSPRFRLFIFWTAILCSCSSWGCLFSPPTFQGKRSLLWKRRSLDMYVNPCLNQLSLKCLHISSNLILCPPLFFNSLPPHSFDRGLQSPFQTTPPLLT